MAKKDDKLGKCALCKIEDVELRDSHIIPKLVYRRIKEFPNSRFRNIYQIKDIYQDGEKKPMLCHDCEQFFNRFETPYTNKILDPYLNDKKAKPLSNDILNNYIYSMSWRVIYDDLYNANSFTDSNRNVFEGIENTLWSHLNDVRLGKTNSGEIQRIRNHVFHVDDFGFKKPVKELFSSMTFGYCFTNKYSNLFIMSYYLGLVYVTEFKPMIIDADNLIRNIKNHLKRSNVKARIKDELLLIAQKAAFEMESNEAILNDGLRDEIRKRYNKKC